MIPASGRGLAPELLKALALALILALGQAAHGASSRGGDLRLLMFDSDSCEYCERFLHELGDVYPITTEGRRAPLSRHSLSDGVPSGLVLEKPVLYTPTFVLLDGREEVGRITGYPGEDHFWGLLGVLLNTVAGED